MDFMEIYERINEQLPNWGFEVKESSYGIFMHTFINFDDLCDDEISVSVSVSNDFISVRYTFDSLEKTEENYELINLFNRKSLYFKAFIDVENNDFLCFDAVTFFTGEEQACDVIIRIIDKLIEDDTVSYLQALASRTKA